MGQIDKDLGTPHDRSVRLQHTIAALFLIAGLVTSSLATCVAGSMDLPAAQMACCRAGHMMCGENGTAADCCKSSPRVEMQFTTVAKVVLHQPWRASSDALSPFASIAARPVSPLGRLDGPSPPSVRRSTYRLLSVLRV